MSKKYPLCLIAAFFAAPAIAQDKPSLPLWEAGIGAGFVSTPAYPGAETQSHRVLALPFLIYRGEVLRSDQQGIGARLLHSDTTEFDIGFAASLPASSKDVPVRAGMADLGTLVEFGPRVKVKLADIIAQRRPPAGLDHGTTAGVGDAGRYWPLDLGRPARRRVRRCSHQPLFL
jgi:hypothetical protein